MKTKNKKGFSLQWETLVVIAIIILALVIMIMVLGRGSAAGFEFLDIFSSSV